MFQNGGQKVPKMLDRNWENRLCDHFDDLKRAWWSQRRLHKASSCSFWPPFYPIWTSVSVSCSCSGITANIDRQSSSHSSMNELCCPQLVYHTANVDQQSSSHSSINELCCPQLVYQTSKQTVGFDVHHSLFTISDHISHVASLSLFSKFTLTRVSNTRTSNQGMTKQLSPVDHPIQLSPM